MKRNSLIFTFISAAAMTCGTPVLAQEMPNETTTIAPEQSVPNEKERARLQDLSHRICLKLQFDKATGNKNSGSDLDRLIMKYNGWEEGDSDRRSLINQFFNERNQYLICPSNDFFPSQHWMMRAIEIGFHKYPLVNHYLDEEVGYSIDFNFVVTAGYDRGTIIDYIDSVRLRPDYKTHYAYKEIEELRYILTTFYDAKSASELGQGN